MDRAIFDIDCDLLMLIATKVFVSPRFKNQNKRPAYGDSFGVKWMPANVWKRKQIRVSSSCCKTSDASTKKFRVVANNHDVAKNTNGKI